jgi:hypothetical protein
MMWTMKEAFSVERGDFGLDLLSCFYLTLFPKVARTCERDGSSRDQGATNGRSSIADSSSREMCGAEKKQVARKVDERWWFLTKEDVL